MDEFGMLARDFGFRPQGKSAPMKSSVGSDVGDRRGRSSSTSASPFVVEDRNPDASLFSNVFGGTPKYTNPGAKPSTMSEFDYDSIFKSSQTNDSKPKSSAASSSLPVYDKPVYDEDIFDGLPGLKSKSMSSSSRARFEEDVFASMGSPPKRSQPIDHFDDLLGNLGRTEKIDVKNNDKGASRDLDDLIPGFGSDVFAPSGRSKSECSQGPKPTGNTIKPTSSVMEDPFVVLQPTSTPGASSGGSFTDPLEEISILGKSTSTKAERSSFKSGIFDDIDPLNGFGKSVPSFSNEVKNKVKDQSPSREGSNMGRTESPSQRKAHVDDFLESHQPTFDTPTVSKDSHKSVNQTVSMPSSENASYNGASSLVGMSPRSEEHAEPTDDSWLTVSEIPLFTQPTSAPPPSRPPPPIPRHTSKHDKNPFASNVRRKGSDFSSLPSSAQYQSPRRFQTSVKSPMLSPVDDLDNFAMGRMQNNVEENFSVHSSEELNSSSDADASAAAMKEAMERAEAKFRHAKEVRERENAKAGKSREFMKMERGEATEENLEGELRENQEGLEHERRQREREEEERERRRLEKERAKEIERERVRQAVERATREARERAAAEAREKAAADARLKAERAAVQRAQAEARERAAFEARERAERAAAEARERAAAEAKEKAAVEAREREVREKAAVTRAEAEAKRRAERAAVERAAAEARERAAAEARERAAAEARERAAAAAAARVNQQKNENDLETFFNMNSRPSSAPRPRASSPDPVDPHSQNRGGPEVARRTSSSGVSSSMKKASSTTNIVDDLSSIFGAASSGGEFQVIEGESEERRRARLERHQRTQERAAKALAEKNQRDLQTQREQEERHRIAETLDIEIKRWAAGKEGNLRALLSTLQYVLWPECGWQPVSLTDLITGASVKKVYRKATLCIHPDKVQQKGANLLQKYIAEKVFDLLKEAWNKFNSEELF